MQTAIPAALAKQAIYNKLSKSSGKLCSSVVVTGSIKCVFLRRSLTIASFHSASFRNLVFRAFFYTLFNYIKRLSVRVFESDRGEAFRPLNPFLCKVKENNEIKELL